MFSECVNLMCAAKVNAMWCTFFCIKYTYYIHCTILCTSYQYTYVQDLPLQWPYRYNQPENYSIGKSRMTVSFCRSPD